MRWEKTLIERAYRCGATLGLAVWCEDEAGPFQAVPHPGRSWRPQNEPATQPHEYVRGGTAKILTLFQPATGQVRLQPVTRSTNAIVHPWLKTTLTEIMAALPAVAASIDGDQTRRVWQAWQEGLTVRFTLPDDLPPLRLLLIWDNLTGHKTPEMVLWLRAWGHAVRIRTNVLCAAAGLRAATMGPTFVHTSERQEGPAGRLER